MSLKLNETVTGISEYYNLDTEKQQQILDGVETHSVYTEESKSVTLGDVIGNYAERTVVDLLIGQRPADDSEINDANWNYGILSGFQSRKKINLVKIKPLLEGFRNKLETQDNDNMIDFYQRRVDACEKHLSNGKDLHIADGQHRMNHIVRVFHPHSEVPIVLDRPLKWEYESTDVLGNTKMVKIDINGRSMSGENELPEIVKQRILMYGTNVQITETDDDVLIGEMFYDDNSAQPAPPSARINVLARSPLKSQLEKIESERSSKNLRNGQKYTKIQHWSLMDFLKDRCEAGGVSNSIWGANANGFQAILLNGACRLYGDDFGNTGLAHNVQSKVVFVNVGFETHCSGILLHPLSELTDNHYREYVDILHGMAVAHDKIMKPRTKEIKQWDGQLKHRHIVNHFLFADGLLNGHEFKGKYNVDRWDEIMSEFAEWDRDEQEKTKYETWTNRDVVDGLVHRYEKGSAKYILNGKKNPYKDTNGKRVYVKRNEGYCYESGKNQYDRKRLDYRSECIHGFCTDNKDKWLTKKWLSVFGTGDTQDKSLNNNFGI